MDKRKNARVKKGNMFKMEWMHSDYLEHFLNDLAFIHGSKSVLNLCSGSSLFGSTRIDHDMSLNNPTDHSDVFEFLKWTTNKKYDLIYVDPPFKFYNPGCTEIAKHYPSASNPAFGNPYEWQYQALNLANKLLVLRRPLIMTNWSGNISKFQEYFLVRDSRPSCTILELVWCK